MLAHALTGLRLLLALPTAAAFAVPHAFPRWAALAFMMTAIITDLLDGKVARARGTASSAGQLFDHSTDCFFVSSALAGAAFSGLLNPWLPALVPLAFAQYALDSRLLHRQKQLRMSTIGRWNGILYFVPPLLLAVAMALAGTQAAPGIGGSALGALPLYSFASALAWGLVASTLVSIVDRALAPLR